MTEEQYKQLSKEYALVQYYQLRNHVGAYALSKDEFMSKLGKALYWAIKRRKI